MVSGSLTDHLVDSFSNQGDKPAISFFRGKDLETRITYFQLDQDSNRMARILSDRGVRKGDRVILFIEKSLVFVTVHLAIQKLGAIAVPLNPGFKKTEMAYLLKDAEGRIVLTEPGNDALVKEIEPRQVTLILDSLQRYQDLHIFQSTATDQPAVEIKADDPGLIIYTSGTTGRPKGATLTHGNLVHDAKNIINIWEISKSDVLCHALPMFHVHGLCFALHTALLAGAHVLMLDQFNPANIIDVLSRKKGAFDCTMFMAVPAMYAKLIEFVGPRKIDFDHVRLWTSGSAPLLPVDFERIAMTFSKEPVEREGMSETGMNFSNPVQGQRKPGSIGLPLPDLEVRIVDPAAGSDVVPGQTGEIWLRGPAVTPGYWGKSQETAAAFENGWFRTGDLGHVDTDGYYYLTDRMKHIIISGGENISPKEIEMVINRSPGVKESSVVGIPDQKWGEKIVAVVVPKTGADVEAKAIQEHCKAHLHDWKCPKEIVITDRLPRNTMGKVLKETIKAWFPISNSSSHEATPDRSLTE